MVKLRFELLCATVALALAPACKPNLEGRPSAVLARQILAVRTEACKGTCSGGVPGQNDLVLAEPKPSAGSKTPVTYQALFVGPDGDLDATGLDWAFCNVRKPIAASGIINTDCLEPRSPDLMPIDGAVASTLEPADAGADAGAALVFDKTIEANLAENVCSVFGPSPPTPKPGQPPSRPADPDTTGGYYQPLRIRFDVDGADQYAVAVTRIACGVGGDVGTLFNQRYHRNENPALDALSVIRASGKTEVVSENSDVHVTEGEQITFSAAWSTCAATSDPTTGPCTGAEPYVVVDDTGLALTDRREAMRVSWFATEGDFDHDNTGRTEEESTAGATTSDNVWTAPAVAKEILLWIVIRDDRGGVGWREVRVDVQP